MKYAWRATTVKPGGFLLVWFPDGGGGSPTLPAGWTFFWPALYAYGSDWHKQWAWGVRVPLGAAPGPYSISTPYGAVAVTVVAAPAARPVQWVAVGDEANMATYLAAGKDLQMAPGRHDIPAQITYPPGSKVFGDGAVLYRRFNGDYANRMFVYNGAFTLEGVTLDHEGELGDDVVYFHQFPVPAGDVTVRDVTVRKGALMRANPDGFLCHRTKFDRGSTGQIYSGAAFIDCDYYGPIHYGTHSCYSLGMEGSLMCSQRFHGTTRGLVLQSGDVVGCVFMDLHMDRIRGGEGNANENILFEGAGTVGPTTGSRHNAFVDIFQTNGAGPGVSLFGSGMHDNHFWNVDAGVDTPSISLVGFGGNIGPNDWNNVQATGAVKIYGTVSAQAFESLQFLDRTQMRGNQGAYRSVLSAINASFPFDVDATALATAHTFNNSGILHPDRTYTDITSVAGGKRAAIGTYPNETVAGSARAIINAAIDRLNLGR